MKNSELKKLVSQYKEIKNKQTKKHADSYKLAEKLKEIRAKKTKGIKLNELSMAYPKYIGDDIYLYIELCGSNVGF